jgi:hypothetical protein
MNVLEVFQRMKQFWTPERFIQGAFENYKGGYCALGALNEVTSGTGAFDYYKAHFSALGLLAEKLQQLYPEEVKTAHDHGVRVIPFINDGLGGYENIMAAVDAILLDLTVNANSGGGKALATEEIKVDTRELVPA